MNLRKPSSGGLVYSTDSGRMCPACRQPMAGCSCKAAAAAAALPKGDGTVRVSCETKGRGGKAVTVIRGLDLDSAALAALGKRLRTACGAGGAVKDGVLELQGDHRSRVVDCLGAEGWKVKLAGG
jgi:translation initiation factor 1